MSGTERSETNSVVDHGLKSEQAYDTRYEATSPSTFIVDYFAVAEELIDIERDFSRWYGDFQTPDIIW